MGKVAAGSRKRTSTPRNVAFRPFETEAAAQGYSRIAGVDEAGRGPLAGPVVAAAVVLSSSVAVDGLADSKTLTARKRDVLYGQLTQDAGVAYAVAVVSSIEIDDVNILRATHAAMARAVAALESLPDFILVDGLPVPGLPVCSRNIVKGDRLCRSIAAASIVAKVHRDRLMCEYDRDFPQYGFARHKGYGTREHMQLLMRYGPCAIHRQSFAPVAAAAESQRRQPTLPLS